MIEIPSLINCIIEVQKDMEENKLVTFSMIEESQITTVSTNN